MTAALPRLLVEWIDRSTALIQLPDGTSFPAISEAGWHTVGGPDDAMTFDEFEGLLGWLQEQL